MKSLCFNSLQTGKCIQRQMLILNLISIRCFNSLQTGKCIQRNEVRHILPKGHKFQFPSNGKVYSEVESYGVERRSVNGFNSLQTGKCIQRIGIKSRHPPMLLFQFPSNGKVYSEMDPATDAALIFGFNSLQTGKCIQRLRHILRLVQQRAKVSIPFKRESVFRENTLLQSMHLEQPFQFPSNGKVYSESPYFKPSRAVAPYG